MAAADQQRQGSVGKRVFLADSADGGRTWTGFRPVKREDTVTADIVFGEAHGHLVQLSDGTVVLVHERRYAYDVGDVRARVSRDEGQTWAPEAYRLSPGHGYAASVVLADDTMVTALGNTPLNQRAVPLTVSGTLKWSVGDSLHASRQRKRRSLEGDAVAAPASTASLINAATSSAQRRFA